MPELDKERFLLELDAELEEVRALMLSEWGQCPTVEVKVLPALLVSADFKMKGFAHKGSKILVFDGNAHRRTGKKVAHEIMGEVVAHRNTCAECGVGGVPLYSRAWRMNHPDQNWDDQPLHVIAQPQPVRDANGDHRSVEYFCADGTSFREYLYTKKLERADVPADAVEARLSPGRARTLNKAIASYRSQHPEIEPPAAGTCQMKGNGDG